MRNLERNAEKKDFYKELFALAIPIGLQNLLVALTGASDALMLGRLTQDAVAAASITSLARELITCVCKGISAGAGIMVGKILKSLKVYDSIETNQVFGAPEVKGRGKGKYRFMYEREIDK
ncbi:MAG: MATE family efflux transporter [Ruminococcus flavefaciens]|nr:MATE family efflux transporter [Roseburia sp.]MCM1237048.1 MATE family efflux transporter [Ruminococcus flavefaciens]